MRPIMFIPFLIACGCAGPELSGTDQNADARQENCSSSPKKFEQDRRSEPSCRPQPGWLEQVGNALSGSASAFRGTRP